MCLSLSNEGIASSAIFTSCVYVRIAVSQVDPNMSQVDPTVFNCSLTKIKVKRALLVPTPRMDTKIDHALLSLAAVVGHVNLSTKSQRLATEKGNKWLPHCQRLARLCYDFNHWLHVLKATFSIPPAHREDLIMCL